MTEQHVHQMKSRQCGKSAELCEEVMAGDIKTDLTKEKLVKWIEDCKSLDDDYVEVINANEAFKKRNSNINIISYYKRVAERYELERKNNLEEKEIYKLALAQLEEKNELKSLKEFKSYFEDLYGQGLEVANWHQNGDTEPFDSFFESALDAESKALREESE